MLWRVRTRVNERGRGAIVGADADATWINEEIDTESQEKFEEGIGKTLYWGVVCTPRRG